MNRGIIGGRASGAAATGGTGGAAGGAAGGGTGGVTGRAATGVGGRIGAAATTGVDGRAGTGVDGRAGTGGASVIAGVSPVGRLALATTPGVKTGVGFLRCGGGEKGVAKGIEGRGVAGVGIFAVSNERRGGGSNASGAASASDSMTARSLAAQPEPTEGTAAEARAGVGVAAPSIPTRITAPHTEQRARTPPGGTFEGSTRNTD